MEILQGNTRPAVTTGERVRTIRKSLNMTQKEFSASLGIVQGFLCSIERGRKVPSDTLLIALQHLYRINPDWLRNGSGEMLLCRSTAPGSAAIPLYGSPPAVPESVSGSAVKGFITIPGVSAGCFAFEYSGDFMSPTIRDGDIVIVKPGGQPVSGEIILIVGQWGDSFLRRYRRRGDEVLCSADNASYAPFKPDARTKIIGTVEAVWRKIKI